jgi:broad specificity phosphatase PhoE
VLVVSSGGPISVALGQLLGMPAHSSIELNLQMRNTSVSELRASAQGHRVISFNTLPHLADAAHTDWVTYA